MSNIRLQRYDFGALRDFRGPLVAAFVPEEIEAEAPPPPPPPTFSEEELASARAAGQQLGYSEGFEAGLARAAEQADAQRLNTETTIQQMSQLLHALQSSYQQIIDQEAAGLTDLVTLIAKKVAGEALQANSAETIAALVSKCLPVVLSKPRLAIELNPAALETTMNQIESLLQANGYEGEIQFRANPALGEHDTILDWGSGQATRNTAQLWEEIDALLAAMPVTLAPLTVNYQIPPEPEALVIPTIADAGTPEPEAGVLSMSADIDTPETPPTV